MISPPVVEIDSGRLAGAAVDGVHRFLGIPYGADTSGRNRFRPPQPVAPWPDVRPALAYGPAAPQAPNPLIDPATQTVGEDCLVLNVWTPVADSARRPVLVWIHGGGYFAGSAVSATTDGAALAREHDVVVVSVNHRLGLLGFLDLADVDPELAGSGNAGMLDLVAALRWVRTNVAVFGGDPEAVTVFGHSGGGGKVTTLLTMPAARGLFRSAGVHGGPPFDLNHVEKAARTTDDLRRRLDRPGSELEVLRGLGLDRLLELQAELGVGGRPGVRGMRFAPTIGRPEVPSDPDEALLAGVSADVDLLAGTCLDEARYAMLGNPRYREPGFALSDEELTTRVGPGLDDATQVDELITRYRDVLPGTGNAALFFAIASDQFRIRTLRLLQARIAGGGRAPYVYLCEVNQSDPLGAFHSAEMPFFFNTVARSTRMASSARREALGIEISGTLARFARTGSPAGGSDADGRDGAGSWPAFDLTHRQHLVFDDDGARVVADPRPERRLVWDGIVTGRRSNPWARLYR